MFKRKTLMKNETFGHHPTRKGSEIMNENQVSDKS
jgi:hypothetical protein